jgi:PAS domain S-box-containing protein
MAEEVHFWQVVRDSDGEIKTWTLVDANPPTLQTWGKTLAEIQGKTADEIFGPGAAEHYLPIVRKIMSEGVPYSSEDYFPHIDKYFRFTNVPLGDHFITTGADITAIKRAEQAVRQTQEWLRVTLTSIGDAVIAANTSGQVTFLNPTASALTGWQAEEAHGRPIRDVFCIFNEKTRQPAEDIISRVLQEGRVVELANSTALMSKNGRLVPIEDSAAPIRDSSGEVVGIVLVFHDVTEKRRAQRALRQSEERYRGLVELSPDAILVHRNERVEYLNPAAVRLLGASVAEQIAGKSVYELFHSDYHAIIRKRIAQLRQGQPVDLIEQKLVRLDGRIIDTAVTASPFVDQNGPAVQAILHDVTERKLKEEQARKFNRTLRALNNSSQALLRATTEQALLERVCEIITADCGYAMVWIGFAEHDEQQSVRPVAYAGFEEGYLETLKITWADSERGRGPTGTAIRTGQPSLCRNMLTDPKFQPWRAEALKRGYRSSLVLPLMAEGKAFGAITVYSKDPDPFSQNELKLLEELASDLAYGLGSLRLRAAHELAQQALIRSEKLASAGRMAATISHEINNPLAAVMNSIFLARTTPGLAAPASEYLDIAEAELKRVSHITRQALGFYRDSSAPAPASVGGILDSVLDLLKGKIQAKRVLVEKEYDTSVEVMGIAGELRQVFSNLVANSLDAIDENGTITLRVSRPNRGRVRLTVADNGKGIDPGALAHVFEAFFTTKDVVGIGLGLWVSKQIVEKHNGTIRVHSRIDGPHRGTSFSVVLPEKAGKAAAGGDL